MSLMLLPLLASATAMPAATADAVPACRAVLVPRRAGEIVEERDTRAVPCSHAAAWRRLRFDARRGAVIAADPLREGDELGLVYFPHRPAIASGDRIQVLVRIGHVAIVREATALQAARAGQRFFARGDDGRVFVAPRIGQGTDR